MLRMSEIYKESSLQKAFKFTADDLKENRQGRLSDTQAARLRREAARLSSLVVGVMAGLGILTILSARPSSGEVIIFLFCLGVPALLTLSMTVGVTEASIGPRVVTKRTGQVHLGYGMLEFTPPLDYDQSARVSRRWMVGSQGAYKLIIADQMFRLNRDEFEALALGIYTVYIVPTLNKIVALELIDIGVPLAPQEVEQKQTPIYGSYDDEGEDTLRA
jgi:hypothetical protein